MNETNACRLWIRAQQVNAFAMLALALFEVVRELCCDCRTSIGLAAVPLGLMIVLCAWRVYKHSRCPHCGKSVMSFWGRDGVGRAAIRRISKSHSVVCVHCGDEVEIEGCAHRKDARLAWGLTTVAMLLSGALLLVCLDDSQMKFRDRALPIAITAIADRMGGVTPAHISYKMEHRELSVWGWADGDTNKVQAVIQEDPFCVRIADAGEVQHDPSHGLYDISERVADAIARAEFKIHFGDRSIGKMDLRQEGDEFVVTFLCVSPEPILSVGKKGGFVKWLVHDGR